MVRDGVLRVVVERGQQGMPRLGMDPEIADNAHALALGKVALALAGPDAVERYVQRRPAPLHAPTRHGPRRLRDELARSAARRRLDHEEFAPTSAAWRRPILDARGRFLAAIGIAMTRRAFDDEHETLAGTVVGVALAAAARAGGGLPASRLSACEHRPIPGIFRNPAGS